MQQEDDGLNEQARTWTTLGVTAAVKAAEVVVQQRAKAAAESARVAGQGGANDQARAAGERALAALDSASRPGPGQPVSERTAGVAEEERSQRAAARDSELETAVLLDAAARVEQDADEVDDPGQAEGLEVQAATTHEAAHGEWDNAQRRHDLADDLHEKVGDRRAVDAKMTADEGLGKPPSEAVRQPRGAKARPTRGRASSGRQRTRDMTL